MISYMKLLEEKAALYDVRLLKAFEKAGLNSSTYYRALKGADLRFETAMKVDHAIQTFQESSYS